MSGLPARLREIHASLLATHAWQCHWARRCQEFLLSMAEHSLALPGSRISDSGFDLEGELISNLIPAHVNHHDWAESFPGGNCIPKHHMLRHKLWMAY